MASVWSYNPFWLHQMWERGQRLDHSGERAHWANGDREFDPFTNDKQARYKTMEAMMADNGYQVREDCGCWVKGEADQHDTRFCSPVRKAESMLRHPSVSA